MSDSGSSVTLIFYKVGDDWYRGGEPFLNLVAAAAQGSSFTHVEIAIGEDEGQGGRMKNVLRVFNDAIGCEVAERTGINPSYSYLQLGCSKRQEEAMLKFAREQIGKPFSSLGMARALIWPRKTNFKSWFCAELVAACLQSGGLMNQSSSPGAATPSSLYKLYKNCGAVAANPCTLRRQMNELATNGVHSLNLLKFSNKTIPLPRYESVQTHEYREPLQKKHNIVRGNSPSRISFRQLASSGKTTQQNVASEQQSLRTIPLTLTSLDMRFTGR